MAPCRGFVRWIVACGLASVVIVGSVAARAGEASVVDVTVEPGSGGYSFEVTVRHDDEGWDHYANRWEVVTPDGDVIDERVLHHPHENEQPFTRSLRGVAIPDDVARVRIRAHDSVHGYGGEEVSVQLP